MVARRFLECLVQRCAMLRLLLVEMSVAECPNNRLHLISVLELWHLLVFPVHARAGLASRTVDVFAQKSEVRHEEFALVDADAEAIRLDPFEQGFQVGDVVLKCSASDDDVVEVYSTSIQVSDHGIDDLLIDASRRLHFKGQTIVLK